MKKIILVLALFLVLSLMAACSGAESPTPEDATATTAPVEPTQPAPEGLPAPATVPIEDVMNINWQWAELIEVEPAAQSVVPAPENYTLAFWDDNTFSFQADCNLGGGNYAANDGGNMTLELGPVTLAECEPDSLYNQYMALLGSVSAFGMSDNRLVLVVNDAKGHMIFNNGGPAERPEPEPEACGGVALDSVTIDTMGLPYSWDANCLLPAPYDNSQPPGPKGLPEHVQVNFGVSHPADKQFGDPILYIIPVEQYIQLWEAAGDSSVRESIAALQVLLQGQPEPVPTTGLPVLPYEEVVGAADIVVQAEYLTTQMGTGVRFVSRFSQGPNPVTSDNPPLFYIYQGFTEDGIYLVSFFYPVTTKALPNSDAVSEEERQLVDADAQAYLDAKTEELNALSASDWDPDLTTLDAVIDSLEFEYLKPEPTAVPAPSAQLTNINWGWTELFETQPDSQSVIPNPENYVLVFYDDGTFYLLADCNYGPGTYTTQADKITLQVGAMTQAACGEGSLSTQFITLLGQVTAYELSTQKLVLKLGDSAGSMGFANGGPSVPVTEPGEDSPMAVTLEPLNVRSGPGNQYYSYGTVPIGTTFLVTGISEDGQWWVVQIPTTVSPDGQGWINGNYVETQNTENVPVVPDPDVKPSPTPSQTPVPPTSTPGGSETSTPQPGTPTATATDDVNVRSGPGTNYLVYGIMAAGTSAEVVGISEDGLWWVITDPTGVSPDGQGWVSADYVTVTNGEGVPVVPAPPAP